jgi:hypothetical protein
LTHTCSAGRQQRAVAARIGHADHIGVECGDRLDDVAELAIAHMGVNLDVRRDARRRQAERPHRPAQVFVPAGAAQRQPLA